MKDCEHLFKKISVSGSVTPRADLIESCTKCGVARALIKKEDLEYLQNLRFFELKERIESIVSHIKKLALIAMELQLELEKIDIE